MLSYTGAMELHYYFTDFHTELTAGFQILDCCWQSRSSAGGCRFSNAQNKQLQTDFTYTASFAISHTTGLSVY